MTTGIQDSNGLPGSLPTKATPVVADSVEIIDSANSNKPALATLNSLPFAQTVGGLVPLSEGGTNHALTADNGGIVYSDATKLDILAHTTTALQVLQSGNAAAPAWSTATYPATTTINQLLYSNAANTITGLTTANDGVLVTSNTGVPSILAGSGVNNNILMSQSALAPIWSAATYPATTTINQILWSNAANTVTGLATGNSSVLATSAGGVPSFTTSLPSAVQVATGSLNSGTGASATTFWRGDGTWGTPAGSGGTVTSVSGTTNRVTSTGGTTPVIDISASYVGQSSITTLGTITTGTWTGTNIALANGGTNAALTASNGGIFYSTASAGAILAGTATANQMLQSGASGAPAWSTATYPATTTINQILFSSAANTVTGLATANNSVLATSAGGVPSLTTTLPSAVQVSTGSLNSGTSASASTYWRGDGTWASIAGASGGLVWLAAATAASSATVDFSNVLSSTYDNYLIVMEDVFPATNTVSLYMRVGTGSGPTYQATNYAGAMQWGASAGPAVQASSTTGMEMTLTNRFANTPTTTTTGGFIYLTNVNNATNYKMMIGHLGYQDSTTATLADNKTSIQWQTATALTSVRFLMTSGNVLTGKFKIYGVQN